MIVSSSSKVLISIFQPVFVTVASSDNKISLLFEFPNFNVLHCFTSSYLIETLLFPCVVCQ